MERLRLDVLIVVVIMGFWMLVRAVNRVYRRLDRLPPRVVARTIHGDEFYQKD